MANLANLVMVDERDWRGRVFGPMPVLCAACAAKLPPVGRGERRRFTPYQVNGAECDDCGVSGDPTIPALKLERGQWVLA